MRKPIDIQRELKKKGNNGAEAAAKLAVADPSSLRQVIDGIASADKRIKNAAAKTLRIISATDPAKLYPHFDLFAKLMNGEDTILKWIAIDIVGNLSYVDRDNKIEEKLLGAFFSLLSNEVMITAAHAIDNLWKIAINQPRYEKQITAKLLADDQTERNPECRNILAGKTIQAIAQYAGQIKERQAVISFAERNLKNSRPATRKKAEAFLEKLRRA